MVSSSHISIFILAFPKLYASPGTGIPRPIGNGSQTRIWSVQ